MSGRILIAVLMAAACSDTQDPIDAEPGPLDGRWSFEQLVGNTSEAVACVLKGHMDLTHAGAAVSGRLSEQTSMCVYLVDGSAPGGPQFDTAFIHVDPNLRDGLLVGNGLTFRTDWCGYESVIADAGTDTVEGTAFCTLNVPGEYVDVPIEGTWQVTR